MQIVAINEHELERFLALRRQINPDGIDATRTWILDDWASGYSQPAWFFLAQENGVAVGGVSYRHKGVPSDLVFGLIVLPWQADYLAVGKPLLAETLKSMAAQGARQVSRNVTSRWQTAYEQRQLLAAAGFSLRQIKSAFILTLPTSPQFVPDRLIYRSLAEVGEAAFIEGVRQVSAHTLDRPDQKTIAQVGSQQMAADFFAALQSEMWVYQPAWWQLAYTADDALVGLVQPVIFRETPQEGSIGYIGVVPEQRGHHYVDDLLLKAHRILQEAGVQEMYVDTDSENLPMIAAFQRAGYTEDGTNWIYELDLGG